MTERVIVGTFTVHTPARVTKHFECAAWHRTFEVDPGTYTVVALPQPGQRREGNLGHSLYVEIPAEHATVVSASFISLFGGVPISGTNDSGAEEVGTKMETSIALPTYDLHRHVESGDLKLDKALVQSEPYTSSEGREHTFYRWRPEPTKDATP